MPSYQLTLSTNYVPNWNCNEALRELFQNGIDRENEDPAAKFHISYNPLDRLLILWNPETTLHKRTPLLGNTTRDGVETIGKYGEGYKLALLVLLRLGCRIEIENGKEVWIPKIVKSRVFDSDLIQIDVSKGKRDENVLQYNIKGITPEQYSQFQDLCLLFSSDLKGPKTTYGQILTEEKFSGKVFCNSLYVCTIDGLRFGYNMHPKYIELNRDRNKVSEFNLTWETSRMWCEVKDHQTEVNKMVNEDAIDIQYFNSHAASWSTPMYKDLCEMQYKQFLDTYGVNAVVCKDEEEVKLIKDKYSHLVPVVVPEKQYTFIRESSQYRAMDMPTRDSFTPSRWIEDWLKSQQIDDEAKESLLSEAEKWRYK